MIMVPLNPGDRAFAIEWLLEDIAQSRCGTDDALEMLAQLRTMGDVASLERLSRALAIRRAQ